MDSAKHNIRKVIATYIETCPEEFEAFKVQMTDVRATLSSKEFATVEHSIEGRNVSRALYEMPVTLHDMLVHNLTDDQLVWLKNSGEHGLEGGRWFAKTFPVFAIPEKI